MTTLAELAPTFVDIAHRIVWCTVATVDTKGEPRTRVLHPIWEWDGTSLVGWIATDPTSLKARHLDRLPKVSLTYWDSQHDVATADCDASFVRDDETARWLWERFETAPEPLGYDPRIIPQWAPGLPNEHFAALRLEPARLHVWRPATGAGPVRWER